MKKFKNYEILDEYIRVFEKGGKITQVGYTVTLKKEGWKHERDVYLGIEYFDDGFLHSFINFLTYGIGKDEEDEVKEDMREWFKQDEQIQTLTETLKENKEYRLKLAINGVFSKIASKDL